MRVKGSKMQATLVFMAAGFGSRFGGIKQIQPIGPNGEVLMDYAAHDAIAAGFDRYASPLPTPTLSLRA